MTQLCGGENVLSAMLRHAASRPQAEAIGDAKGRLLWTWGQLAHVVATLSQKLHRRHECEPQIKRRQVLLCQNRPIDVAWSLACAAAGWVHEPQSTDEIFNAATCDRSREQPFLPEADLAEITDASDTPQTISDSDLDELLVRARLIDTHTHALTLRTGGSTGTPLGVMLSHANLFRNATAKLKAVPQHYDDLRWTILPITHAYARTCDLGTWLISGCRLRIGLGRGDLPSGTESTYPTHINTVPTIAQTIVDQLRNNHPAWQRLRVVGCGGAAISQRLLDQFRDHRIDVIQGYGLTETSPVIASEVVDESLPRRLAGIVGKPVEHVETRIQDDRLWVRGPGNMIGYENDAALTEQRIDSAGWLDTGDRVRVQPDGSLQILGRDDDVIVLPTGHKVDPVTIERFAYDVDGVQRAVMLMIDDRLTLAVEADTIDTSALHTAINPHLPPGICCDVVKLEPPLSRQSGELTIKLTPNRNQIRHRWA
ncbi:MAG: AMP-binding protein [Planctomycetota bacterium]